MSHHHFKTALAAFALFAAALQGSTALAQAAPDGDKDGIADSVDDCPYTPVGAKVDRSGCALDEDFDGVADGLDKCAATPLGAVVDGDGCTQTQVGSVAPPPVIALPPPAPPAAGVDPFSTQPASPIQAYPLGQAPTPSQVSKGEVAVPPVAAAPRVPDQVRDELDARAGKRPATRTEIATSLPPPPPPPPPPPYPPSMAGASAAEAPALSVPTTPPPAPLYNAPYDAGLPAVVESVPVARPSSQQYQRAVVTAPPRLSTDPVLPSTARAIVPPVTPAPKILGSSSYVAPVPFSGGAPVDPFSAPVGAPTVRTDWSVDLGAGASIGGDAERVLLEAIDHIKQAQRENAGLSYEVAGSEAAAVSVRAYLLSKGVAASRLLLKTKVGAGSVVKVRPAE